MRHTTTQTCEGCGAEFQAIFQWAQRQYQKFCSRACYDERRGHDREESLKAFWEKVNKNGPGGCWLWTACTNERGYGMTVFEGRKNIRAHRMAYELVKGPIPEGMFCLHKCDVRRCVNPDHIFFGLYKENAADAKSKGRHTYGERNTRSRLTEKQVLEIRQRYPGGGKSYRQLAAEYGVAEATLYHAATGRTWKHLPLSRCEQHEGER
jgi:hypothetical protein